MLKLSNITKKYEMGDSVVTALDAVDLQLRANEFVAILGPSGCGKTTMLNIIGGLDRYNSGDLEINGVSTKEYKDSDWDSYRNHSIGFVFQSYNLIPHQSVLANVELALTLTGVSKTERRKRAVAVLEKVGLKDQLNKKPNQMSGGQMQRVAIARALINNPEILLADEPTGALDSETSVQIMDLLKEIAKEKLVIMVTHNPEIANEYATRTVRLLDGKVIDDSDPYVWEKSEQEIEKIKEFKKVKAKKKKKTKKPSMSLFTALSLSMNNLLTKKTRTFMTSFAGSIGIIGIALILSLSTGFQLYINKVQEDTLSSYPLSIAKENMDYTSMMETFMGETEVNQDRDPNKIYSNNVMNKMTSTMLEKVQSNNLTAFKKYLESGKSNIKDYVSDIKYSYDLDLQIYSPDTKDSIVQVNPNKILEKIYGPTYSQMSGQMAGQMGGASFDVWQELIGNEELLSTQYEMLSGNWPNKFNEIVLIVDKNNEISDMTLYSLGIMDQNDLEKMIDSVSKGKKYKNKKEVSFTYNELLSKSFKLVLNTDYFTFNKDKNIWVDKSENEKFLKKLIKNAQDLNIVGIVRPSDGTVATAASGGIGYTKNLTSYVINNINDEKIVKDQKKNKKYDIFSGIDFDSGKDGKPSQYSIDDVYAYISTLQSDQQAQVTPYLSQMSEEEIIKMFSQRMEPKVTENTYDSNLAKLGVVDLKNPSVINLYPKDFDSKDNIESIIKEYNDKQNKESNIINYTDFIGVMMSSISTIINVISYVLIAFVSISLIVSSIMIGIITYISVLERTKEIGILRSIGASKKDISRVFNAETLIVGLVSGLIGIGVTILLNIPINLIIKHFTDIPNVSGLPIAGAITLVLISMILTVIAGLIPSKIAAKKDPVEALRSE